MLFQHLLGPVQRLQDIAVGGGEVRRAGIFIRRVAGLCRPARTRPRTTWAGSTEHQTAAIKIATTTTKVFGSALLHFFIFRLPLSEVLDSPPTIDGGQDNPFRRNADPATI